MRIVLAPLVAAAILLPSAALASDSDARRMSEELHDPARQARIATVAEAMADAVLGMPVGPLMRAAAEAEGRDPEEIDPDTRVGDLAGPDAAEASYEFAHRLPRMMGALATMALAMEDMLPELRARIEEARGAADSY